MSFILENWNLIETILTLLLGGAGENIRQRAKKAKTNESS